MKLKSYLTAIVTMISSVTFAQHFSMSGSYSPTFDSYSLGFGFGDKDLLMDYKFGISDEFFSFGLDLGFQIVDFKPRNGISVLYLGFGGEMYLMDDVDRDLGYSIYPSMSISYNQFVLTYGYGFYEYDGDPIGDLDAYHMLKLTIIFADID
ncbi:MAG: hypothetical protein HWE14_05155 [Flavobacteriia bacterium]|nr:hypothetical protein [Flavobacteriia bacterium]